MKSRLLNCHQLHQCNYLSLIIHVPIINIVLSCWLLFTLIRIFLLFTCTPPFQTFVFVQYMLCMTSVSYCIQYSYQQPYNASICPARAARLQLSLTFVGPGYSRAHTVSCPFQNFDFHFRRPFPFPFLLPFPHVRVCSCPVELQTCISPVYVKF